MTPSRLLHVPLFIFATAAGNALALDTAPGTTSPTLQANGCTIDSGDSLLVTLSGGDAKDRMCSCTARL